MLVPVAYHIMWDESATNWIVRMENSNKVVKSYASKIEAIKQATSSPGTSWLSEIAQSWRRFRSFILTPGCCSKHL